MKILVAFAFVLFANFTLDPKLGYYWWTGGMVSGYDRYKYSFKWSPGNTPITHGWNQGEPNNSGNTGEKCVSMKHGTSWWTGGWAENITSYGYYWDPGNTPITISWNKGQLDNQENRETPVDLVNGGLSDYKRFEWIPHICEYSRSDLK
ncbi:hypothetical protein CAPTEDRAFT_214861 [Capitella teleta]|uniref:C-type lectin domain-containing protein n=1 Tax=Capitella teleta TaxID=283909 RepID=R7U4W5_CAPTE|nr:hypothetical protein CAPTEDRAFT_214861 [Capitella teleta]|eukprot:ELU00984.1 hypothetical protein CAPTEDRAFT_214861 [Capitella teleta]